MEKSSRVHQKRRRFPNLPIQLKYAAFLSVTAGFISLVMIFVMAWFIQRNYTLFMGDELGLSPQVVELVRSEQSLLESSLLLLFIFSIATMFTTAFWVTRRLTGPVLALERHLHLYARGEWHRVFRLRKDDEFKELEHAVNEMRLGHLQEVENTPSSKVSTFR